MLNVLFWIVTVISPQPQSLTEMPPNREGLPARKIELVTVRDDGDEDWSTAKYRSASKKRLFSRMIIRARLFNRTGKRKSLNY